MTDIDNEVEQKQHDLDAGGGSAKHQNPETKPSLWQRIITFLKQLLRL